MWKGMSFKDRERPFLLWFYRMWLNCCRASFILQISASFHWIQTQQPQTSYCLTTTNKQRRWKKSSRILIIQRDFPAGHRSCALKVWLDGVTGRYDGTEELIWAWHTGGSRGEGTVMTAVLEGMISPGVFAVLPRVTLPGTTTGQ